MQKNGIFPVGQVMSSQKAPHVSNRNLKDIHVSAAGGGEIDLGQGLQGQFEFIIQTQDDQRI